MWIKICANTNLTDASLAAELGADALGFVFAPSPRRVTPEQVAAITSHLPAAVEKIGVFSTVNPDEIIATVHTAGLTGVQLHGAFIPALVAAIAASSAKVRIIQTSHWKVDHDDRGQAADTTLAELRDIPALDAVLVDSRTSTASGGTGVKFDWNAARAVLSALAPKPLIVAGGLRPENVQEAIAILQPWGVDVASGVEATPGRKDPVKLAAFLRNGRKAS